MDHRKSKNKVRASGETQHQNDWNINEHNVLQYEENLTGH
jgi:hypothetical protein